jgi:hypothetical protein
MPRARFVWMLSLVCGAVVCASIVGCKDTGSGGDSSKGGFRLSLSKREIPVVNRAAQ